MLSLGFIYELYSPINCTNIFLFEALSWRLILSQPYIGWINMKTYSLTNFTSLWDDLFLAVTGNRFKVWNYNFSGPTGICLFEFSSVNSEIKCKVCSKLNRSTRRCFGVFIINFIISMLFKCFFTDFEHVDARWNTLLP